MADTLRTDDMSAHQAAHLAIDRQPYLPDDERKERKRMSMRTIPQLKDTAADSETWNSGHKTLGTGLGTLDTILESLGTGKGLLIGSLASDGSWRAAG